MIAYFRERRRQKPEDAGLAFDTDSLTTLLPYLGVIVEASRVVVTICKLTNELICRLCSTVEGELHLGDLQCTLHGLDLHTASK